MHHHPSTSRHPGDDVSTRPLNRHSAITILILLAALAYAPAFTPRASAARGLPNQPSHRATATAQTTTAPLTLRPPYLIDGLEGAPYRQQFSATGGVAPYAFTASFYPRPIPGLTFTGDGLLSGTPTGFGGFYVNVIVTDARGESAGNGYALDIITPIAISPPYLVDAKVGSPYSQTFAASGGVAPYTFTASYSLPAGLSLSPNGVLSGTPVEAGSFDISITATDARGVVGAQSSQLLIAPPFVITPGFLPNGSLGVAYNQTIAASGGAAPYTFAVAGGALPPGLTLSSAGALKGTPSAGGYFSFGVAVTDARGLKASQFYTIWIVQTPLILNPSSLPDGQPGVPYRQRVTAGGGASPYTFAVTDGALPPGLKLGRDGQLSGTPTAEGYYSFGVTATDARGRTGTNYYGLLIALSPLTISPDSLPNGKVGVDYRQRLTASGGNAPYTFAAVSTMPPGLTLRDDGRILGRPTATGSFAFEVAAKDARGRVGGKTYYLMLEQSFTLAPSYLPTGMAGTPYAQTITAVGGKAPYSFAVTDGALPPGLSFAANGTLSGTPTAPGSFGLAITATDSRGVTSTQVYGLWILTPIAISPPDLPTGKVGDSYGQTFAASGGTAPYTFAVIGGELPPGLSLGPQGKLGGTPTAEGNYDFTIEATDARGIASRRYYSVAIAQALYVDPPYLPGGTLGEPYTANLSAGGGTAPYAFARTGGTLPLGLALSADGALSGTPTAEGWFVVEVTATDARGRTGRQSYSINITRPQIVVSPGALPNGKVGVPYRQQLSAGNGVAPYIFYAQFLPGGLTLTANGLLQGTPTEPWDYSITISVFDANGSRANLDLPFVVEPIAVTPYLLPNPIVGVPYRHQLAVSGGTAPYTFVLVYGSLPEGISLGREGLLSGTTSTPAGSYFYFQVRVIDANGYTGQQNYDISVAEPLALSAAALPDGAVGSAYTASLSASGGSYPYSFAVTDGALPPGLTLSADGTIDGAPSISGTYTFAVTVTDFEGRTATQSFAIAVS